MANTILVNDDRRLYAADLDQKGLPKGWRRVQGRSWDWIKQGYCYAPPWEVVEEEGQGQAQPVQAGDGEGGDE